MNKFQKFALISLKVGYEFTPVIAFIVAYKVSGNFFWASGLLIFFTLIISILMSINQKRLPIFSILMSSETIFFGGLTLLFMDEKFLKIRDTFYDFSLGLVILATAALGAPLLERVFKPHFDVGTRNYQIISMFWGFFFIVAATLNEFIRRNFSTEYWVDYKTFMIFVTVFFGVSIAYLFRHKAKQLQ